MDELIKYSRLFDIYRGLLSSKQVETFKDYYFENLTIEEIAESKGISKNAVSKMLMTVKRALDEYEGALHFSKYMSEIQNEFKNEEDILNRINKYDNIVL